MAQYREGFLGALVKFPRSFYCGFTEVPHVAMCTFKWGREVSRQREFKVVLLASWGVQHGRASYGCMGQDLIIINQNLILNSNPGSMMITVGDNCWSMYFLSIIEILKSGIVQPFYTYFHLDRKILFYYNSHNQRLDFDFERTCYNTNRTTRIKGSKCQYTWLNNIALILADLGEYPKHIE